MRNDGSLLFLGVAITPVILDLGLRGKEDQEFKTRLSYKVSLRLACLSPCLKPDHQGLWEGHAYIRNMAASVNESPEQQVGAKALGCREQEVQFGVGLGAYNP